MHHLLLIISNDESSEKVIFSASMREDNVALATARQGEPSASNPPGCTIFINVAAR
jgi:hypothetical protein